MAAKKKGGKGRRSPAQRAATKRLVAMNKARAKGGGGSKKKKGGGKKGRSAAQRAATKRLVAMNKARAKGGGKKASKGGKGNTARNVGARLGKLERQVKGLKHFETKQQHFNVKVIGAVGLLAKGIDRLNRHTKLSPLRGMSNIPRLTTGGSAR